MVNYMKEIINKLKKDTNNLSNIIYRRKRYLFKSIWIIYNETLISTTMVSDFIIRSLDKIYGFGIYKSIINNIDNFKYKEINAYSDICKYLNSGFTILLIDKNKYIALETKKEITRSVSNPITENVIRGPLDAFNENIEVNIGLIKRRIKDNNLWIRDYEIGKYTKTKVSMLYMNTIVKKNLVERIDKYLTNIDIDGILTTGNIKNLIHRENKNIFPMVISTEKPFTASKYLLEGNIVILVDNDAFALILPTTIKDYFYSVEDEYNNNLNVSLNRIVRYISFFIALVTPAFYISIITYNQEILPTELLLSIAAQRENVHFSAFVEAFLMISAFEILRESDLKVPSFANSSISIVGALILGEAAVSAGIVSPIMIIVVAITSIASLTFTEPEMINSLRFYRFLFMLGAALAGMYGIFIVFIYFVICLSSTYSFGLSYTIPFSPLIISSLKDSIIKFPILNLRKRNKYLSDNVIRNRTDIK